MKYKEDSNLASCFDPLDHSITRIITLNPHLSYTFNTSSIPIQSKALQVYIFTEFFSFQFFKTCLLKHLRLQYIPIIFFKFYHTPFPRVNLTTIAFLYSYHKKNKSN